MKAVKHTLFVNSPNFFGLYWLWGSTIFLVLNIQWWFHQDLTGINADNASRSPHLLKNALVLYCKKVLQAPSGLQLMTN
jgi:hypothetical protein